MSLRVEIHLFLTERSYSLAEKFNDDNILWIAKLTFFSDIFEPLNKLNV